MKIIFFYIKIINFYQWEGKGNFKDNDCENDNFLNIVYFKLK